jgi:uncharacterized membrane protein
MIVAATLYDWLKFVHILAAMLWVGGLVVLGVLATQVLRSGESQSIARLVKSLGVVGPLVLAPSMLAVLGLGIWLVIDSEVWDFAQTWVWLALVLFVAAFAIGAIFQSRAAIGARRAAEAGDDREARRQLGRWSWGMRLLTVLLVVITWDMTIKPGL